MRTSINLIKFSGVLSLVFVIITYVISLNNTLTINFAWITKDFALAISSGIFAGFFVMLICEIQKYLKMKEDIERNMFYQTMYLYIEIFLINKIMTEFLENKDDSVPYNLLSERKNRAICQVNALRQIDYVTFCKKNFFAVKVLEFSSQRLEKIEKFLNDCDCLEIAIRKTEISNLQKGIVNCRITSSDEIVSRTFTKLSSLATENEEELSLQLQLIDDHCKNRLNWKKLRDKIRGGYRSLKKYDALNQLLNEEN